jgi:hypothetical protein
MMDLRACEALKFALADLLRAISGLVPPHDAASRAALRALFARLAEDRFEIALAGRFSRGKSSLMNAMLGMDRLPTGVVPLTSVITRVTYGSAAKVVLHYRGTSLFSDIPLAALALGAVLEHQAARLRRIAHTPPAPALIGRLLPDGGTCPACRVARRSRDTATAALAAPVARDGVAAVHARSALCLPHLAALAGRIDDPAQLPALARRQAALMERMAEDARRLALKHDAGRQGATSGEEQQAPRDAARMLLGRGSARLECLPATRAAGR